MDTTDPEISFDERGICSHCRNFEENIRKDWHPDDQEQLRIIAESIKAEGEGREYDSIMGLSGGVDSSYLAYQAKRLGLRPLAVHVDAGWNSEIAVKNIENLVKKLGFDLHTYVVDWDEMQDLQASFFRAGVANQDVPQDHAFTASLYREALKKGIKTILSGGNIATESILPPAWAYNAMDLRHLKAIHKRFGKRKLKTYPTINFFQYYIYYPYIRRIKTVRLLNYLPYNKEEAIRTLESELGWRNYGGKHFESRFTKFQQAHFRPIKFGYEERKAYLSSLILSGQMSREDAIKEMEKKIYSEDQLQEDQLFVIKKLGLSKNEFKEIMAMPNKTYRDYPSNSSLFRLKDRLKGALGKLAPKK